MSRPHYTPEERAAWDRYMAAAMGAPTAMDYPGPHDADYAAKAADDALAERRKRFPPVAPPPVPVVGQRARATRDNPAGAPLRAGTEVVVERLLPTGDFQVRAGEDVWYVNPDDIAPIDDARTDYADAHEQTEGERREEATP